MQANTVEIRSFARIKFLEIIQKALHNECINKVSRFSAISKGHEMTTAKVTE